VTIKSVKSDSFLLSFYGYQRSQGLVAERIRRQPCNRKIAGSIPVYGRYATPFRKEFTLTMLAMVTLPTGLGKNQQISTLNS